MWIWQGKQWPKFSYQQDKVLSRVEACAQAVAPLVELAKVLDDEQRLDWEAAILLDETLASAKIEDELYDRESVRSSIVDKLGISSERVKFNGDQHSDAFVELLLLAIRSSQQPLELQSLLNWHQILFPVTPLVSPMRIGQYRDGVMQIISGRYGKQTVHYQAPGENEQQVEAELQQFISWFNQSSEENREVEPSGFIRAAIAKYWFVTIHPFDDGNGRLSRIIAEKCLAQVEQTNLRLFSLSSAIEANRQDYYQQLEKYQTIENKQDELDLTEWILWFLTMVETAAKQAKQEFERVIQRTKFWQQHQQASFNQRQIKLLKRLLETQDFRQGISRKKYRALVKTTDATATRDITSLVEQDVLTPIGEGRSRRYLIKQLVS